MSPEAQRIAIAEACGWTKVGNWDDLTGPHGRKPGLPFGCVSLVPNYPTDLNAMHEAEITLTNEELTTMLWNLKDVVGDGGNWFIATAAQRAEAFLRTIGKLEES